MMAPFQNFLVTTSIKDLATTLNAQIANSKPEMMHQTDSNILRKLIHE